MPEDHEVSRARKRAKKENSLKHGVYSREVMLPGENIRCYETLVAETTEEWAPEGATERSLVDRLVGLFWRRQRLERYEQSKLQERIKEIRECNLSNRVSELKDLGPRFENAASDEEVDDILAELSDACSGFIEKLVPYDESLDSAPRGPAIAEILASLQPKGKLEGPAQFIALVDPCVMEANMERSNRIDEAIDRTIKRLMQVKTAKQIFPNMRAKAPPKLISTAAPTAQDNIKEQNVELLDKVVVFAEPNPSWPLAPADFNLTTARSAVNSVVVGDGRKLGE